MIDLIEPFLALCAARGNVPTTVDKKRHALFRLVSFLTRQGVQHVQDVTPSILAAWQTEVLATRTVRGGQPLSGTELWFRLGTVKEFFDHLVQQKIVFINPVPHFLLPKRPERLPRDVPTQEQIEEALGAPDIKTPLGLRNRAILELFYSAGLRRRELATLNLYDVDLVEGVVHVRQGKGGKDRTVPVGKTARAFITQYIRTARNRPPIYLRRKHARTHPPSPALFLTQYGRQFNPVSLNQLVKKYLRPTRSGQARACHALRHACATHMMRGGAHIRYLQELLGHTKIETTQIYTHVCPLDLKEAHKKHHPHG